MKYTWEGETISFKCIRRPTQFRWMKFRAQKKFRAPSNYANCNRPFRHWRWRGGGAMEMKLNNIQRNGSTNSSVPYRKQKKDHHDDGVTVTSGFAAHNPPRAFNEIISVQIILSCLTENAAYANWASNMRWMAIKCLFGSNYQRATDIIHKIEQNERCNTEKASSRPLRNRWFVKIHAQRWLTTLSLL